MIETNQAVDLIRYAQIAVTPKKKEAHEIFFFYFEYMADTCENVFDSTSTTHGNNQTVSILE